MYRAQFEQEGGDWDPERFSDLSKQMRGKAKTPQPSLGSHFHLPEPQFPCLLKTKTKRTSSNKQPPLLPEHLLCARHFGRHFIDPKSSEQLDIVIPPIWQMKKLRLRRWNDLSQVTCLVISEQRFQYWSYSSREHAFNLSQDCLGDCC